MTGQTGQEDDRTCEVLWLTPAAGWDALADLPQTCRVRQKFLIPVVRCVSMSECVSITEIKDEIEKEGKEMYMAPPSVSSKVARAIGNRIVKKNMDVHVRLDVARDDCVDSNALFTPLVR